MENNNFMGELFPDLNSTQQQTKSLMVQHSYLIGNEKPSIKQKMKFNNWHLSKGMDFTLRNEFPKVSAYKGDIPSQLTRFNELSHKHYNRCLHFYQYDYTFDSVWHRLEFYTPKIAKFRYVIAPDFSLYVDTSKQLNYQSLYRNRFVTAYWQQCGVKVIPSASWGNADSFEYCFEGLPQNSVIAIGSVAVKSCEDSIMLWRYGVSQVIQQLNPTALLIYGSRIEFDNQGTQTYYYNDFINTKFRK
ncbi:MAG: DUF4417 domain-containing protein [Bacteroidales bacterium]|nr:DUF4417 domain-containing protein [Bacteroidales bacterium]